MSAPWPIASPWSRSTPACQWSTGITIRATLIALLPDDAGDPRLRSDRGEETRPGRNRYPWPVANLQDSGYAYPCARQHRPYDPPRRVHFADRAVGLRQDD